MIRPIYACPEGWVDDHVRAAYYSWYALETIRVEK